MAVLLVLGLTVATAAEDFRAPVVGVTDGDTITILRNGRHEALRLHGIDAPEKGQAFGDRAKQFTSGLAFGKTIVVRARGRDRFGRTIADVFLPDGRNLNQEMVRAGYAWWYRRYSVDQRLAVLEAQARAARRGLWAEQNPLPPWEHRRRHLAPAPHLTLLVCTGQNARDVGFMPSVPDPIHIGRRIVETRGRLGLSQVAFARRARIARTTLSLYERGNHLPKMKMLTRLAIAGNVTVNWLLNGTHDRVALGDRAWEAAVSALRVVWAQPRRRRTVIELLRALGDGPPPAR